MLELRRTRVTSNDPRQASMRKRYTVTPYILTLSLRYLDSGEVQRSQYIPEKSQLSPFFLDFPFQLHVPDHAIQLRDQHSSVTFNSLDRKQLDSDVTRDMTSTLTSMEKFISWRSVVTHSNLSKHGTTCTWQQDPTQFI